MILEFLSVLGGWTLLRKTHSIVGRLWVYFRPIEYSRLRSGLADNCVLVTGATDGIGRELAAKLARNGVSLIVHGRSQAKVDKLVEELRQDLCTGASITGWVANFEDDAGLSLPVEFGKVQVLVNNAGVSELVAFGEQKGENIEKLLRVNLRAAITLTHKFLQNPVRSKRVIFVSSFLGVYGMPLNAVYSATKAGLLRFGEALSREYSREELAVLSVTPFYVSTKMVKFQPVSFETVSASVLADNIIRALCHLEGSRTPTQLSGSLNHELIEFLHSILSSEYLDARILRRMRENLQKQVRYEQLMSRRKK